MERTLNERSSHDLEAVLRRDHRDRSTLEVARQLSELNEAVFLRLRAAELVDKGVASEEVERVAEPGCASGVDGEHVVFVGIGAVGRGERVQLELATCEYVLVSLRAGDEDARDGVLTSEQNTIRINLGLTPQIHVERNLVIHDGVHLPLDCLLHPHLLVSPRLPATRTNNLPWSPSSLRTAPSCQA
jgi:hypothetical protein